MPIPSDVWEHCILDHMSGEQVCKFCGNKQLKHTSKCKAYLWQMYDHGSIYKREVEDKDPDPEFPNFSGEVRSCCSISDMAKMFSSKRKLIFLDNLQITQLG